MPLRLRHLVRTRQQMRRIAPILKVLVRHGFGHFVQRIARRHFLPAALRVRLKGGDATEAGADRRISTPQRLVMVLQELGPTFVKLGQMLATRADLLPEPYIQELRVLTEQVPPFNSEVAKKIIEAELGKPIADLFAEFDETPVASGSIGQVYHAVRHSGEQVVVKVKRPDIERIMLADLDLLELIAEQAERVEELRPIRPCMMVEEFRRLIRRELDFVSEASYTAKICEDLCDNPHVRVPTVYWDMTTGDVLTLERLEGVSLRRKEELVALDVDRRQIARNLAELFLHQFFKTGLFHADPHPGNILVAPDGKICLVDFGMAGRLDADLRRCLATSFIALASRDLDVIADVYMEIGAVPEETDLARLKADLNEVLDKYYGIPIDRLNLQRCFADEMRVARTHGILLPRDFVLLGKSFVTMVMMARELDPSFDLAAVAKRYALSLVADKFSPTRVGHDVLSQIWYIAQSVRRLPREMRRFTRKLLAGTLQVTLRIRDFEDFLQELDRATNRLAFSIIVSAIVIGSSVVLHAHVPPYMENVLPGWLGKFFETHMQGTSALGLAGFLFAGILGMLLAVAIWRRGRL